MAEEQANQGSGTGAGGTGSGEGNDNVTKGLWAKIKEAFNLGSEGKVAADVGVSEVSELNSLKESLKKAEEAKLDTASITESIGKAAEKVSEVKNAAFNKSFPTFLESTAAKIGGNFSKDVGKGMVATRIGGTGLGSIMIGSSLKGIIAPQRDENGERKDSMWKQVAKLAGGAAIVYASLIRGGANKAMSMAK